MTLKIPDTSWPPKLWLGKYIHQLGHAGLDPASRLFLDSGFRRNAKDKFVLFMASQNISFQTVL
jgi:hypothetical protein